MAAICKTCGAEISKCYGNEKDGKCFTGGWINVETMLHKCNNIAWFPGTIDGRTWDDLPSHTPIGAEQ